MGSEFSRLHDELCRLLGPACEPLMSEGDAMSFSLQVEGTRATALHAPGRSRDCVLVVVSLGQAPDALQQELAQMELIEANFSWMVAHAGLSASCHPDTGELCIQFAYPFAQAGGANLLARIAAIAEWSAAWGRTTASPELQ